MPNQPRRSLAAVIALLASLLALGAGTGCGSGVQLEALVITPPSGCPEVEVSESSDVTVCHKAYGHWTGRDLIVDGQTAFSLNREILTAKGHVIAHYEGNDIAITASESAPDIHLRVAPSGKVVDAAGKLVATIKPLPMNDQAVLILIGIYRAALAAESQAPRCACANPPAR